MNQAPPAAYPPPPSGYPPEGYPAYGAPPPPGYPSKDDSVYPPQTQPIETKSKGDGFWKGCLAALCCCCVLDACF